MQKILKYSPVHCAGLLLAAVATLYATMPSAHAAIANRYSFTSDVSDSVGAANGTLQGTASVSGGQLVLAGGGAGASYADLPDGLASSASSGGNSGEISVETWVTANSLSNWAVIFSFGNSGPDVEDDNGSDGDYWQLIPQAGVGDNPFRSTTHLGVPGGETFADTATMATGQLLHVINVLNVANNTNQLYIDGALVATSGIHPNFDPNTYENATNQVGDTQNWLGRSQWGDPSFDGSYDEFRVYDHALTPKEVLVNTFDGPDNYNPNGDLLSVLVDPSNGQVQITNNVGADIDIDYYEILSPTDSNALNPGGWSSFADNDGSAAGDGWDESDGSDGSQLIELYLGDPEGAEADTFSGSSTRSLGTAFTPGNSARDLVFQYGIAGTDTLSTGTVTYGTISGNPSDADGDGDVDGADFLKLQRENPAGIPAWEAAYGTGSLGAVSGAAIVPEPATGLGLLILMGCGLVGRSRRSA